MIFRRTIIDRRFEAQNNVKKSSKRQLMAMIITVAALQSNAAII